MVGLAAEAGMGAFYVINSCDAREAARLRARVEDSFAQQGFGAPVRLTHARFAVGLYAKRCGSDVQLHEVAGRGFAALTGTGIVDGECGARAAAAVWRDVDVLLAAREPDFGEWIGQFCALVARDRALTLFLDPLGIHKAYRRRDGRVIASSFLAVAATLERPLVNTQCVYEYLFQEATYADETVLDEVALLRSGGHHRLDASGGTSFSPWSLALPAEVREAPLALHVDACLGRLRFAFERIARCFGDRVDTALSGGYDSRLLVALLIEQGVIPSLHVYGDAGASDVAIAHRIARAERLRLEHVDKSAFEPLAPEQFADAVARNFSRFDGYPPAGILDGGADLATREQRAAGGRLMLNGGGGEVLRNFFYLRDRPFTAREVVFAFYSRYDPAWTSAAFDEAQYIERLAHKLAASIGCAGNRLTRLEVERLYPEFRCRYWMGRNNAINNRLGFALTPFADPLLERVALAVPLEHKDHGRLEAAMIRTVSPSLARHRSDYGHAFDAPPPLSRIVADRLTLLRPPWLRRYTYRLRHRKPTPGGRYLAPRYVAAVVDPRLPIMARYLRIERLHDPGVFQRACTLEYLFRRLDATTA